MIADWKCSLCGHEAHYEPCRGLDAAGDTCDCQLQSMVPDMPETGPVIEGSDKGAFYGYKISMKITLDKSLRNMIEILEAGGTVTLTYPKGNKKVLKLEDA